MRGATGFASGWNGPIRSPFRLSACELVEVLRLRRRGVYSDELVKREGRWPFLHRSFALQVAFDEKPTAL